MGTDGEEENPARVEGTARAAEAQVAARNGAGLWVTGQRRAEWCWGHCGGPATGTSLRLFPLHPAKTCQTLVHTPAKAAAARAVLPGLMSPAHHHIARGWLGAEPPHFGPCDHMLLSVSPGWGLWDSGCSWGWPEAARAVLGEAGPCLVMLISPWSALAQPTALCWAPQATASRACRVLMRRKPGSTRLALNCRCLLALNEAMLGAGVTCSGAAKREGGRSRGGGYHHAECHPCQAVLFPNAGPSLRGLDGSSIPAVEGCSSSCLPG